MRVPEVHGVPRCACKKLRKTTANRARLTRTRKWDDPTVTLPVDSSCGEDGTFASKTITDEAVSNTEKGSTVVNERLEISNAEEEENGEESQDGVDSRASDASEWGSASDTAKQSATARVETGLQARAESHQKKTHAAYEHPNDGAAEFYIRRMPNRAGKCGPHSAGNAMKNTTTKKTKNVIIATMIRSLYHQSLTSACFPNSIRPPPAEVADVSARPGKKKRTTENISPTAKPATAARLRTMAGKLPLSNSASNLEEEEAFDMLQEIQKIPRKSQRQITQELVIENAQQPNQLKKHRGS
ncbi:hypothetical protein PHYPSEUDO_004164 [Phytophthora pseudosyringae]|uniref:Uncharacterized protein n=1 Tax=Phytophthora pseudosyringae TaxID=221518 RepID=A0A8T1VNP9_9STRA|nr:hypothetical protein PHYPSEUDO_004164 [Phytophthora pseudosyringae]